jgi:hypothetical protein
MSQQRGIGRAFDVPPLTPGFVGPGHLAASVVSAENFEMTAMKAAHLMLARCSG